VKRKTKILLIVLGVILLGGLVAANLMFDRKRRVLVESATIKLRDLESIVSASGRIEAKRKVNVSANTMGKITRLAVEEGDRVEKGDFLVQIDPTQFQASVASLEAALRGAEAQLEQEEANREKRELDLKRLEDLLRKNLVPQEELDAGRTALSVARAQEVAAREEIQRYRANLANARYDLDRVTMHAELSGVVTRLNIEEGENVVTGTMNNPGTVLMTIADLSEIEAEIEVDETDVVDVRLGQEAEITIDAYPDQTFKGKVSRIGNSAITDSSGGSGPQAVNFRVEVTLTDQVPNVRPGFSCTAEITVAVRHQALSVPIQSLTIRKPPKPEKERETDGAGIEAATREPPAISASAGEEAEDGEEDEAEDGEEEEVEGVFVIRDGTVHFRSVEIGISGERHFEIISGLEEGEDVVTGPYKAIRELEDLDPVKVEESSEEDEDRA
jgi:HlyD family secretion protein